MLTCTLCQICMSCECQCHTLQKEVFAYKHTYKSECIKTKTIRAGDTKMGQILCALIQTQGLPSHRILCLCNLHPQQTHQDICVSLLDIGKSVHFFC